MKNWRGKRRFFTPWERRAAVALAFVFAVMSWLSITGRCGA